jgi:hypothetical protein
MDITTNLCNINSNMIGMQFIMITCGYFKRYQIQKIEGVHMIEWSRKVYSIRNYDDKIAVLLNNE